MTQPNDRSTMASADDFNRTFLDDIDVDEIGDPNAFKRVFWQTNGLYTHFTKMNKQAMAATKALQDNLTT